MYRLILVATLLFCISCADSDRVRRDIDNGIILTNQDKLVQTETGIRSSSTTAGNLIASAIRDEHRLDIVLYPTELLNEENLVLFDANNKNAQMIDDIVNMYPGGTQDQFLLGTMKGRDIAKLITDRSMSSHMADLQTAGLNYRIDLLGGWLQSSSFAGDREVVFDEDRYYRVAVSNYFYFSGNTFPSYRFGNSMSFSFKVDGRMISARESLRNYLNNNRTFPDLTKPRAIFRTFTNGDLGFRPIYDIQGTTHRSAYYGKRVLTKGVVVAAARRLWYPFGYDIYIQDYAGDGKDETSDAIHIHIMDNNFIGVDLGDLIEVSGTIYEEMTGSDLTRTSIQEVKFLNVIQKNHPMPEPVLLGDNGRQIPSEHISTYKGDLNFKTFYNLEDGIDFWESLEGMRVTIENPRIAGFRGGKEDEEFPGENRRQRGYLNLYVIPNGDREHVGMTTQRGILADEIKEDFNPEVIQIVANHLSEGIPLQRLFNVGNLMMGQLTGVLTYDKNLFGDGEYTMVVPEAQEILDGDMQGFGVGISSMASKPKTTLVPEENKLTVATYNLENLAANQPRRIKAIAQSINTNLKCPDIVNLVEIQDNNGLDFQGGSAANRTIEKFLGHMNCGAEYGAVNIDPIPHTEGGQPGGNIRVVMIYNKDRVSFTPRGNPDARTPARIDKGRLVTNPSRVFPLNEWFIGTRGSLVAEFEFKGKKIIMIGNHFNSKLGDISHWTGKQPVVLNSEEERGQLARQVNILVGEIEANSDAHIIVLGDFNSLPREEPMIMLESGNRLHNLMKLLPPSEWYTTNHNGNSQALDYIFVGNRLMQLNPETEVPHINSDYMGRHSDHDPVMARFTFPDL